MNYRHIYHAGNFADVVKHIVLMAVLEQMKKKEKGFTVLDAFSGIGIYNLNSEAALKTQESNLGIQKLVSNLDAHIGSVHTAIVDYVKIIQSYNTRKPLKIRSYVGSPVIISEILRPQDKLICVEKHTEDFKKLKENMKLLSIRTAIHNMNGYDAIKCFLPFQTQRGLIVIDPAFEVTNEFDLICETLSLIKDRCVSMPIFIWYPIKDQHLASNFRNKYNKIGYKESIFIEFGKVSANQGLERCGIIIANPPHIAQEVQIILAQISTLLFEDDKSYNTHTFTCSSA